MNAATPFHEQVMQAVLDLARAAVTSGAGLPFGAVVVDATDGRVLAEAHNEVLASLDPTAHAELLAIRRASAALRSIDLQGCAMYTNVAPCCMCMSSALWANVDQIYYLVGMEASDSIGLGDAHLYEELSRPLQSRRITPVTSLPILQSEALDVLTTLSPATQVRD